MVNAPKWEEFTTTVDGQEKIDYKILKKQIKENMKNILPHELCTPAITHFNLFHNNTPKNRYISFFFSGNNQKFQFNYPKSAVSPELLTILVEFSKEYKLSLYMSEFCYITGKNRKETNVCSTNVITLDLDKKNLDIKAELPYIQTICQNNGLNLSAVFGSGRGHYLVFKLDEAYVCANNTIQLQRWKWNYDRICDLFQDYEADYKCKDISRVFRLMGSYNYKDNTSYATKILYEWDNTNHYLDIPCCKATVDAKMFEPETILAIQNNGIVPKRRKKAVAVSTVTDYLTLPENNFFKGQNKRRLNDLLHLIAMRDDHLGDRHAFLYVIINQLNISGYSYEAALEYLLKKVNPKFSLPESEYEIVRQLQSIYKDNKLRNEVIDNHKIEYIDNHYHGNTTQWIIETLNITEEEQAELSVLKNKKMLHTLRQEKRLAKSRCRTQNKKEQALKEFNQSTENCSIAMIAEKTNLSRATIYKKLEKTPKQVQMEKENTLILSLKENGASISEIAETVGLSYETTKKRLQRLSAKENEVIVEEVCVEQESEPQEDCNNIPSDNINTPVQTFSDLITAVDSSSTDPPNFINSFSAEDLPW